jgi:membrane dipeptidase
MLIVDSHLDLAWNALLGNRDLTRAAYTIRAEEAGASRPGAGRGTVALPELRRGRVALCFATLLARCTGTPVPWIDYRSPEQACSSALGQLAYYRALERRGEVRVISDRSALDQHIGDWRGWEANGSSADEPSPPVGFVLSMESADALLDPGQLAEFWAAGVRVIGPAHYGPGRYAGGTGTEEGLSESGIALLREMDQLECILDMSHFSDQAFWQALDCYGGPVLASHNNCRALVPHQRQFSDEQLRAIIARGGVIGVAMDVWMLELGWTASTHTNAGITLDTVVDHIDHICQVAGDCRHAAIGSDLDGLFGREQSPCDLDTIADLQKLAELLAQRGYAEADIATVMHGNWLRLLRESWS